MSDRRPHDLVVVGFGAAGVCAAIEAAEAGARVLALDRFGGGGATAISGGVVYAGAGTSVQREAGVEDDVDAMCAYLHMETQGVVGADTLRRFCQDSPANLAWLAAHGVPFRGTLCPDKTSYPSDEHYLYYSGNEGFSPFKEAAKPAPRGHRAVGSGLPGANFYAPLRRAALKAGVVLWTDTRAQSLIEESGVCVGVRARRISPGPWAWLHRALERVAVRINPYAPRWGKRLRCWGDALHRRRAVDVEVRAGAVLLTTGGFIYDRDRVEREAPGYRPGMPLGTVGCDGSGIAMAESMGAATAHLDRVSAWRFINPPVAFARGVLVDARGERFVNEALYGAALGEAIVEGAGGKAWLVLDDALVRKARRQVGRGRTHWFQTAPALLNLWFNARKAATLEGLARRCRLDPERLAEAVRRSNDDAVDPQGKPDDFRARLVTPPYYAIDCGIRSKVFPLPTLTLGGLVVSEDSGAVRRPDGGEIPGLYAAGRAAVGICSRQYVSGLSLADCVFSGRRAGASIGGFAAPSDAARSRRRSRSR